MKQLITTIALLGFLMTAFAQNDSIQPPKTPLPPTEIEPIDSSHVDKDKGVNIKIEIGDTDSSKRVKTRFLMLDRGISTYLHNGSLNLPVELDPMDQNLLRSAEWNLHLIQQRVSLHKKNRVNISYGLTLSFNKYKFNNNYTLLPGEDEVTFVDNPGIDFKKNQLHTTHIIAPIMLGFRLKPKNAKRSFTIKAGVYGGFLLASKTKQKIKDEQSIKVRDDFNLNKVRYGITARAGYGIMNLYVNYSLSTLFKENQDAGYDLQPITFGVSIIPF